MARGQPDWLLLTAQIALLLIAAALLIITLRTKSERVIKRGLAIQSGLSVLLITLMLLRYPQAHSGYAPLLDDSPAASDLQSLLAEVEAIGNRDDAIVTILPESYLNWLDVANGSLPDSGFGFENPLRAPSQDKLARIVNQHNRVWLISEGTQGGNAANGVEVWLAQNGYAGSAMSSGNYRAAAYTFSDTRPELTPLSQTFGNGEVEIELVSYRWEIERATNGNWLNVWLRWQSTEHLSENYTVFVHVLDADWQRIAQHDGWPAAAFAPTSTWTPGFAVDDRHNVSLPASLPPGQYRLIVGLYRTSDQQLLQLADGSDHQLQLATLNINPD